MPSAAAPQVPGALPLRPSIALDTRYISERFLAHILPEVLRSLAKGEWILTVLDENKRPLYHTSRQ